MLVFDDKNFNEAIVCLNKTKMSVFVDKNKLCFKIVRPKIANLQKIIMLKYYCIYLFISNTMEVSTTCKVPVIVLSIKAKELIEEMVQIF